MKSFAFILFLLLVNCVFAQYSDSVRIRVMNTEPVAQWERAEVGIQLPAILEKQIDNFLRKQSDSKKLNPFLEWEIRVEAIFQKPSGVSFTVDGFYYESFDPKMKNFMPPKNGVGYSEDEYRSLGQYIQRENQYSFRARVAPDETGDWKCSVRVLVSDTLFESEAVTFNVRPSEKAGLLTVGNNGRFLERGGKAFYPVGCNMPWPQTSEKFDPELFSRMKQRQWDGKVAAITEAYKSVYVLPRVYDRYRAFMKDYADGGMNTFRTIMYPTGTEIEWEELGNYSRRMSMAYELDQILDMAEDEDVVLFWNLQIHYTFQYAKNAYGVNWSWDRKMNGFDYCYKSLLESDDPLEFFQNEEAKKYYKQRLRYILSRWGYSANIGVFELFSEISNVGTQKADHSEYYRTGDHWKIYRDWQVEMAAYIKSQYNGQIHPLTGSYAGEKVENDDVYESRFMDVMASNIYNFSVSSGATFWVYNVAKRHLNESGKSGNSYTFPKAVEERRTVKPLIYAETDPLLVEVKCDSFTVEFDRSLWQSAFSGLAGSLSWMQWFKTGDTETYYTIQSFMKDVELDRDGWHPGASTQTDGAWMYNEKHASRMVGWVKPGLFRKRRLKRADLIYLRKGNKTEAIGVLSNLTWNVYTTSDCYDQEFESAHDLDRMKRSGLTELSKVDLKKEKLAVRDLKKGSYQVEVFSTSDLQTPLYTDNFKGKKYKFKHTSLGLTSKDALLVFRISPLTP